MRCVQLCAPGTALPCNMLELEATCLGACEGVCLCLSLCEHSYFTALRPYMGAQPRGGRARSHPYPLE